jgi:RNA polymerase sigma-70 factor
MARDASNMPGALFSTRVTGALAASLHARAGAARWGVSIDRFHEALERTVAKRFGDEASARKALEAFVEGLHHEDLALAIGCADGAETAWEAFVERYWADFTRAARAMAGDAEGDEICSALMADLFARSPDGEARRPLFDYFHGRSRLSTWLRALASRRHVDRIRATRRLEPLEDESGERQLPARQDPPGDPDSGRLVGVLREALGRGLAALPPRDRLRLAFYHADGLTLAAIGRQFGEHEATVSRKLQRTRDRLRAEVDAALRDTCRLGPDEIARCYEDAIAAGGLDLAALRPDTVDAQVAGSSNVP